MPKQKFPQEYAFNGVEVACPICRNREFWEGKAQLNTAIATFFNFDWVNKEAITLQCAKCGNIQWFDPDISDANRAAE